jgi:hypothetical protein
MGSKDPDGGFFVGLLATGAGELRGASCLGGWRVARRTGFVLKRFRSLHVTVTVTHHACGYETAAYDVTLDFTTWKVVANTLGLGINFKK